MKIDIPETSLVVMVGPTASGKTSFARKHFLPTEVVSSDFCRAALADDENDQSVTAEAFELLHYMVAKRLKLGKLTVVDATNVRPESRKSLIALAREYHVLCVALVFDLPEKLLLERHAARTDRNFGAHVVRNQRLDMHRSQRGLQREGFRYTYTFRQQDDVDNAVVSRNRLWTNLRHETGPFDIVGDVHGCLDELRDLMLKLGYETDTDLSVSHPAGRKLIFVGDLVDRGPDSTGVVRLVSAIVKSGAGFCVAGNHDAKLVKALNGRDVKISHGLMARETPEFRAEAAEFLDSLISHYVLDSGKLVVAHAGLSEELQGRSSGRVRSFAMYGETTGETDEFGFPVRYNWARDYRGNAMVVYGHTPVPAAEWLNNTICLDTGCVFGGEMTALRYPERELVSVPAREQYYEPVRPITAPAEQVSAQHIADDMLDFADVSGKRYIRTSLNGTVQVNEENAAAALELMSRFAANPKWLIYLPPTMSPSETSTLPGMLEHPAEALHYFRKNGVAQVVCEEKHMGSRAVVIVCKDEDVARRRFGVSDEGIGIIYTRTGRAFFADKKVQQELLLKISDGLARAGLWDSLESNWVCLDCELMPWSAKALDLIKGQYAPVGASGTAMLAELAGLLDAAEAEGRGLPELRQAAGTRLEAVKAYRDSYARYCQETSNLADIRLAPFHLLASEGRVHVDQDHVWHMQQLARLAEALPELVVATPYRVVDLADDASCLAAIQWWEALTRAGGEGMVVKPLSFAARARKGLIQPAIKCRGPEYLRIIYGPEYLLDGNLGRLRERGLSGKRSLALKEFSLGIESLERFVRKEPLRHIHECVFGVLALESEPIDPRL